MTAPAAPRALDAAVAERVMGWTLVESGPGYYLSSWFPSTDIAAAWQVVERMHERGYRLVLESHWHSGSMWSACFVTEGLTLGDGESWGASAPWCICSAAIAALAARKEAPPANG